MRPFLLVFTRYSPRALETFASKAKVKLAGKSALVLLKTIERWGSWGGNSTVRVRNSGSEIWGVRSANAGRGSNFGDGGNVGRSIELIGTEQIVIIGLKRYNSEFFKSELAKATEAALNSLNSSK